MKRSLLWHVAQVALGLLCWVALIVGGTLAFIRDAFRAFVNPASNRDRI